MFVLVESLAWGRCGQKRAPLPVHCPAWPVILVRGTAFVGHLVIAGIFWPFIVIVYVILFVGWRWCLVTFVEICGVWPLVVVDNQLCFMVISCPSILINLVVTIGVVVW